MNLASSPIALSRSKASANKKRPHGGVAPHGLVIFRFTCDDQSRATPYSVFIVDYDIDFLNIQMQRSAFQRIGTHIDIEGNNYDYLNDA